jgi:hypothetical protein
LPPFRQLSERICSTPAGVVDTDQVLPPSVLVSARAPPLDVPTALHADWTHDTALSDESVVDRVG